MSNNTKLMFRESLKIDFSQSVKYAMIRVEEYQDYYPIADANIEFFNDNLNYYINYIRHLRNKGEKLEFAIISAFMKLEENLKDLNNWKLQDIMLQVYYHSLDIHGRVCEESEALKARIKKVI